MDKFSFISHADPATIESMYRSYKENPENVEESWRDFFLGFDFALQNFQKKPGDIVPDNFAKEVKVLALINAYRDRGHLFTKTNPVRERRKYRPTLDIENFGLTKEDLNEEFQAGEEIGLGKTTLAKIIERLQEIYCDAIGIDIDYIRHPEKIQWLREKIERTPKRKFTVEEKKHILKKLDQATVFEEFLHKKFVGQKRFSLQGSESLIPALDFIIEEAALLGIKEFVFGMAHRGRLNVLANIFGKTYKDIFAEFEGKEYEDRSGFDGDVKYHLGYSCEVETDHKKKIKMTMMPNPSHLEAVDPVALGLVRSKIDHNIKNEKEILPILIHGDAAIAGQGIVYEVIQMAQLRGYRVGGTLHIVVNNQVGFTTNYLDGRSSTYCTDVAKVTASPVFHVNADNVEAVLHACELALQYRETFGGDVFIDLLGYRKYGHNEGDEPRFTQPLLYKIIAKHPPTREIYLKSLLEENVITKEEAKKMEEEFQNLLQERLNESKQITRSKITSFLEKEWQHIETEQSEKDLIKSPETGVSKQKIRELAKKIFTLPQDKKFFNKIVRLMNERHDMVMKDEKVDWGVAETLAYATLLSEGHPVRISGQDVERGTFSHRHAVIKIEDSEEEYIPLRNISDNQAPFYIYNSLLSEYAVLGFEYGYAFGVPDGLTVWEAQFGDFYNGAQIVVDQFISSAEDKWNVKNGVVMYLPHGFEGQGAEHSSARIERFLQLCAENNMIVCNPTTPANFFHLLRRHLKWPYRKPLVIFTPKSLLRHPLCVSTIDELEKSKFQPVLDDPEQKNKVETLILCSGKIYYELIEKRKEYGVNDVAIVRIEQLYPFPEEQVNAMLDKYKDASRKLWVQEEPQNMGPWWYICSKLGYDRLKLVSIPESASPSTGSYKLHQKRMQDLFDKVFEKQKITKQQL